MSELEDLLKAKGEGGALIERLAEGFAGGGQAKADPRRALRAGGRKRFRCHACLGFYEVPETDRLAQCPMCHESHRHGTAPATVPQTAGATTSSSKT